MHVLPVENFTFKTMMSRIILLKKKKKKHGYLVSSSPTEEIACDIKQTWSEWELESMIQENIWCLI